MVAQFTNGLFSCPSARILKKDIMWGGKGGCTMYIQGSTRVGACPLIPCPPLVAGGGHPTLISPLKIT